MGDSNHAYSQQKCNMKFFYLVDDRRVGPFNETELLRLYESHILPGETPIILDGETEWSTLGTKFSAKNEPPPSQNTTPESQLTTPPLFNPEAVAALKAYATRIGNEAKRMAINFAIFMAAETKAINQARRKSISDYKTQNTAIFNQKTLAVKAFWHNLTWRQKSLMGSALLVLTYVTYTAISAITSTNLTVPEYLSCSSDKYPTVWEDGAVHFRFDNPADTAIIFTASKNIYYGKSTEAGNTRTAIALYKVSINGKMIPASNIFKVTALKFDDPLKIQVQFTRDILEEKLFCLIQV